MLVLKKKCAHTRMFSNTPFNIRGNHFLVPRDRKKDLPPFSYIIMFLNMFFIIFQSDIQHDISSLRLMSKLYF